MGVQQSGEPAPVPDSDGGTTHAGYRRRFGISGDNKQNVTPGWTTKLPVLDQDAIAAEVNGWQVQAL